MLSAAPRLLLRCLFTLCCSLSALSLSATLLRLPSTDVFSGAGAELKHIAVQLVGALDDAHDSVRQAAVDMLWHLPLPNLGAIAPELISMVEHANLNVRKSVLDVLKLLPGPELLQMLDKLMMLIKVPRLTPYFGQSSDSQLHVNLWRARDLRVLHVIL